MQALLVYNPAAGYLPVGPFVYRAVDILHSAGWQMRILPTRNVMGVELGLHPFGWSRWWALDENLRQLVHAPVYNVDVGLCNGKPFLLWAGLGLDAMLIQQLEPRPRFDKYLSVPHSAALTIWNATFWHGIDLKVEADGQRLEFATPVSLQMDGEPQGLAQNLEFSILPRALKLLVPSRSLSVLAHMVKHSGKYMPESEKNHEI